MGKYFNQNSENFKFKCEICGQRIRSEYSLNIHKKAKHNEYKGIERNRNEYKGDTKEYKGIEIRQQEEIIDKERKETPISDNKPEEPIIPKQKQEPEKEAKEFIGRKGERRKEAAEEDDRLPWEWW